MSDNRYQQRGVSAGKEDVHKAISKLDKGLFPKAFCKIVPDYLTGDPNYCVVMHVTALAPNLPWPTHIGNKPATSPYGAALPKMRSS